ncbi:MBL fold metallo-hydrolase [Kordiimonas sp. SCSIO 12610]|uniref:MBL fold metallo-hydrolase n=1 Tax=Kordiimonas sp. SCSIO 12610 TaxID=2829597 RepID=UPI00210D7C57|nr:MBL fold metallo-hydrolase [Kordiimonas sp. SCSIO 12610]UTW53941.1 MBL fold metallo-hydrolase [Kordiimonas sp. SCSIO 12610]
MKLTILGCGTSGGVPKMPEYWGACDPKNPKNRRLRASVLVEQDDTRLLIDTSPDLREQMLRAKVHALDAVFYTHDHADHTHGIDDLRGFFHVTREKIPVYGDEQTINLLRHRFDYIFNSQNGYPAMCRSNVLKGPKTVGNIKMIPFEQGHGNSISLGYRFGDMAYSTDLNRLPETAFDTLEGVKVWVVDALRYEPHPTHSHLEQTLAWIERLKPERAILTHMTWDMDYEELKNQLPEGVEVAYDGMVLEI